MRRQKTVGVDRSTLQRMWSESPQCEAAAAAGREAARQARQEARKCGAKRKGDGRPCQMLALENGRCRLHGGLTPKGANWHRPRWPRAGAPAQKLDKKLRELEQRRERQAARVAAMTPERRAQYERWHQTHKPGGAAAREAARRNREARALLARPAVASPPSPEQRAIQLEIDALLSLKARLGAQARGHDE